MLTLIIHVDIWMKPIECCFLAQVGQGSTSSCVKVIKESHQPGIPETCISTLTQGHHGTCGNVYQMQWTVSLSSFKTYNCTASQNLLYKNVSLIKYKTNSLFSIMGVNHKNIIFYTSSIKGKQPV